MAFDIKKVNGLGTGALGDVTCSGGIINSYAHVSSIGISGYQLSISNIYNGQFGGFTAGQEILFQQNCFNNIY